MAMGTVACTKDDVDKRHVLPLKSGGGDMPSDGREDADKYTDQCLLQWR